MGGTGEGTYLQVRYMVEYRHLLVDRTTSHEMVVEIQLETKLHRKGIGFEAELTVMPSYEPCS